MTASPTVLDEGLTETLVVVDCRTGGTGPR